MSRRELLKSAAAGLGAAAIPGAGLLGGKLVLAQEGQPFESLVPADKALDPAWVASLYQRGEPEVYAGWDDQLKYVGMPIGGIGCGQLYLGGDGRLWLWDIFKSNYRREPGHGQRIAAMSLGGHYANPVAFGETYSEQNGTPVKQGFAIRVKQGARSTVKTLDQAGFPGVTFRGEYPIGKVTYADDTLPVRVELEAFSPFIPLNARDSALPATVMSYAVTNSSDAAVEVDLAGWLQNATCPYTDTPTLGNRRNRVVHADGRVTLLETIELPPEVDTAVERREDILFADFEGDNWGDWTARGDAFAGGPFPVADRGYQETGGHEGERSVNSHNQRQGGDTAESDNLTGTLASPAFTIDRRFITLSIGGGNRIRDCFIKVQLTSGEVIETITGHNSNVLRRESIDVSAHEGKEAEIRIVDNAQGAWGNIQADQILFTDTPVQATGLDAKHGYGSMALSLLSDDAEVRPWGSSAITGVDDLLGISEDRDEPEARIKPLSEELVGGLGASVSLQPGESRTLDFAITWYFPEHNEKDVAPGQFLKTQGMETLGRHYKPWFNSAGEVAGYLAENKDRLLGGTRSWNQTWNDSTLPHWLLDRAFLTIDCAATQMFHWFDNGRPYGWEGVDCCPGTCTHVWHYAQGLARIFPELERAFREEVDFKDGIGFHANSGLISDRGDFHAHEATDGQAGTILRAYREHQMSADDAFLRRLWPNIKKSIEFLIAKDPDGNGLIEGAQPHTLDAAWHGPMAWVSGIYLAALTAGAEMADHMGDAAFARRCRTIAGHGSANIVEELFDGEYFIHKPDPNVPNAIRSGSGCHIDQVLGEAWARQVALPRVIPKGETVSALSSLWKYNFATDAGGYAIKHREIEQAFRWYAMEGEAGLLMCTWPKGGALEAIPGDRLRPERNPDVWTGPGGYFNECMNGFEYQVAAHMIFEGEVGSDLVEHGLAVTRAIHDRYHASMRNPYNEIECSDHYARSMASYGVFLAACGFEYDGPAGHIGFAPRLTPDNFRAPFTAAEGWGTYAQQIVDGKLTAVIEIVHGSLRVESIALTLDGSIRGARARDVSVNGRNVRDSQQSEGRLVISLPEASEVTPGATLTIEIAT